MARGRVSKIGDERVAPNGYHYVKVKDHGPDQWRLKHHTEMEKILGRKLKENERVVFLSIDKTDFSPNNLRVQTKGTVNIRRKIKQIEARMEDERRELEYWKNELRNVEGTNPTQAQKDLVRMSGH